MTQVAVVKNFLLQLWQLFLGEVVVVSFYDRGEVAAISFYDRDRATQPKFIFNF